MNTTKIILFLFILFTSLVFCSDANAKVCKPENAICPSETGQTGLLSRLNAQYKFVKRAIQRRHKQ